MTTIAANILKTTKQLNVALKSLEIENQIPTVSHVYHPLDYAYEPYKNYVNKYCNTTKSVLFVGMNPSPHGMCQTGIPFGDIDYVKSWLKIEGEVKIPPDQHPRYPIVGFSHRIPEVSGSRLWSFLKKGFGEAENFFADGFVVNYCPVALIGSNRSNLTPESREIQDSPVKHKLENTCDAAMCEMIKEIKPSHIIGIGWYATRLCQNIVAKAKLNVQGVYYLRHPSPRSVQNVGEWEKSFLLLLKQRDLFNFNNR